MTARASRARFAIGEIIVTMRLILGPTVRDKIEVFLGQNPGQSYCDDCVGSAIGVRTQAQVCSATLYLSRVRRGFTRFPACCSGCGKTRKVSCAIPPV